MDTYELTYQILCRDLSTHNINYTAPKTFQAIALLLLSVNTGICANKYGNELIPCPNIFILAATKTTYLPEAHLRYVITQTRRYYWHWILPLLLHKGVRYPNFSIVHSCVLLCHIAFKIKYCLHTQTQDSLGSEINGLHFISIEYDYLYEKMVSFIEILLWWVPTGYWNKSNMFIWLGWCFQSWD